MPLRKPESATINQDAGAGRLRLSRYAIGNLGKNALSSMMEVYGLFYCTEVLGIEPQLAGLIILTSLIWDALVDPMIGLWADRQLSGKRSVGRLLAFGMPATAMAFIAFFHLHWLPPGTQVPTALVLLILFRAAYTLVDVPHNSLLVFAAKDSAERTRLASLRILFSAVGKTFLALAAAWWIARDDTNLVSAMAGTSLTMGLVFVLALLVCIHAVAGLKISGRGPPPSWRPVQTLLTMVRGNLSLRKAFLLTAINSLALPASSVVLIYSAKYQLENTELGAKALLLQAALQALMPFSWAWLARRWESTIQALRLAYASLLLICFMTFLMPISPQTLYFLAAGTGASIAGIFMLNWVYFSDSLSDARSKAQTDTTISAFSFYSVVNKVSHGLAQGLAGFILALALLPQSLALLHIAFLVVIVLGAVAALGVVWRNV